MPRCSWDTASFLARRIRSPGRWSLNSAGRQTSTAQPGRGPTSRSRDNDRHTIEDEHAALIDTSSLRNTLEAVKAANRTRLIRKVDEAGNSQRLSLPNLLGLPLDERPNDVVPQEEKKRTKQDVHDEHPSDLPRLNLNTSQTDRGPGPPVPSKRQFVVPVNELPVTGPGGEVPPLSTQWELHGAVPARFRLPWLICVDKDVRTKALVSRARLAMEIEAFDSYYTPSVAEEEVVAQVVSDLELTLSDSMTDFKVELMGSRATGLASPLSDIDVNLVPRDSRRPDVVEDRPQALQVLRKLARVLRQIRVQTPSLKSKFAVSFLISKARVPILRVFHLPSGLEMQIQHTNVGYNTTEYAKTFIREYPTLKRLFMVVRQALAVRGLTNGWSGGITSYPLLNMIVAALKDHEEQHGSGDVADQFLHFLEMYSDLDFDSTGISITPFKILTQTDFEDTSNPIQQHFRRTGYQYMYLEDPADPSNNLGKSVVKVRDMQATIIALRSILSQAMRQWDDTVGKLSEKRLSSENMPSLLANIIEGDYRTFELDRAALTQMPPQR
ncbi:uncharacterized protein HMPREF1541_09356 [Cyphellophora europaea CBS 101466]|uniref:polynucleotide adenylyltransferase n=1 Tax=Cyphellophora europaea (strain CBS 101466) TaxID=1220924 RepID=W2SC79_CYPE1|nr:uncharacterized protein HMPREF1541_09356 [Cyphellophora europaea CBS 101466]ETN45524.1 hypothetical protein HMPREF1541_09356 [Cyphellophora europaea CBS 101466]